MKKLYNDIAPSKTVKRFKWKKLPWYTKAVQYQKKSCEKFRT